MKRNYKYEKEMLHWLDGGKIEQTCFGSDWEPFDGDWINDDDWKYRIAEKPKLKWVGLTYDEIDECFKQMGSGLNKYATFARAIEAKLREKNI